VVRPLIGLATVVGGWWTAVEVFHIRRFFLPSPPDVVDAYARLGPYLLQQAGITVAQAVTGFAAGVTAGLAVAVGLSTTPWLRDIYLPLIVAVQAIPKVALAPLLIVWLGFGFEAKVALVTMLCFFPVVVATMAGLASTPAELVELARSLNGSRTRTFVKVRIPWAAPQIFTGLKLAVSLSLIGAVVAQIATPNAGLGAVIVRTGQTADTPLAFAAIGLLAAIGIALFYTVAGLERLLLPWARATTG
jgi:NitT/TauT family transport system permease protein